MYIKDREKIEKLLSNLVNEMINQELIEADKKEVKSNFKNAREYEIEQMLEKVVNDYDCYIKKGFQKKNRRLYAMLHCTILKKYWDREELKGLNFKRALKIIEVLEIWEGSND